MRKIRERALRQNPLRNSMFHDEVSRVVQVHNAYLESRWGKSHFIRGRIYEERLADICSLEVALNKDDHALKTACVKIATKSRTFLGRKDLIIEINSILRRLEEGVLESNIKDEEEELTINTINKYPRSLEQGIYQEQFLEKTREMKYEPSN